MFVFAFEGALFALTYNGDSLVLFALLPRLNPRTSVSAATLLFKELNLTTGGYSNSRVPFDRWHGFHLYFGSGTAAFFPKEGRSPSGPRVFVVALRAPLFPI